MLEVIGIVVVVVVLFYTVELWLPAVIYLAKWLIALGALAAFFIFLTLAFAVIGG